MLISPKHAPTPAGPSDISGWRRGLRLALPGVRPATVGGTIGVRVASSVLGLGAAIITARGLGPHGRAQLAVMVAVPGLFSVVAVLGMRMVPLRLPADRPPIRGVLGRRWHAHGRGMVAGWLDMAAGTARA